MTTKPRGRRPNLAPAIGRGTGIVRIETATTPISTTCGRQSLIQAAWPLVRPGRGDLGPAETPSVLELKTGTAPGAWKCASRHGGCGDDQGVDESCGRV